MISSLGKIWGIFTPAEKRKAAWMLTLVVLMAAVETASVLSIMPFLSVLGRPAVIQETPLLLSIYSQFGFTSSRQFIIVLGCASIAFVITSSLFKAVTQHGLNRFIHLQRHSFSTRLLSCYLQQPYEFFLLHNPSILAKNVLSEVDQLVFEMVQPLSHLFAQGTILLAMLILILSYDPSTAIGIMSILAILYGAMYAVIRKRLSRIGHERQIADGLRYQTCNEVLSGIKDVKVTHADQAYLGHFTAASRLFSRHFATSETLTQWPHYIMESIGYTGLIAIALILLLKTNDIGHVLPALGLYSFAAYRMLPSAQIIYRGVARLRFVTSSLDSVAKDLSLPIESIDDSGPALPLHREIRLERIRYAYPTAPEKFVLDGFDLIISANSSLGIVGKSGAGKSTLMDILLGLLHPQGGTIYVDDVPITPQNSQNWQHSIGYVPQHIYLSDASIAENIAFGVPREAIDMRAIERAARAAQIHDFVTAELAHGYDSRIGDRGIRISGGQRQRIGIARALYRDPSVLLMDEATSALDTQTEEALNEAIRTLSGKKTIIVIAHKQASLRHCQKIIEIG